MNRTYELPRDIWGTIQEYLPNQSALRQASRQMYQLPININEICCREPTGKEMAVWIFNFVGTGAGTIYSVSTPRPRFDFTSSKRMVLFENYITLVSTGKRSYEIGTQKDFIDFIGTDKIIMSESQVASYYTWKMIFEILSNRSGCRQHNFDYKKCFIEMLSKNILIVSSYREIENLVRTLISIVNIDKANDLCVKLEKQFNIVCKVKFNFSENKSYINNVTNTNIKTIVDWLHTWVSNLKSSDIPDILKRW